MIGMAYRHHDFLKKKNEVSMIDLSNSPEQGPFAGQIQDHASRKSVGRK